MTEKRFVKGYCCGDTGLVDKEKEEWFVENINSISDSERNWNDVLDKLNEVADENKQLKQDLEEYCNFSLHDILGEKNKEIEQLKKLLECSRKEANDYCEELMGKDEFLRLYKKEIEQLKHNNKMLSMKMSEVYTKYCLLKEFSEDTNPNDAVKRVLSELMQITKEYR